MVRLRECRTRADEFFRLLPDDWRDEIEPHWPGYRDSTRIFCLSEMEGKGEGVIAGGMVFSRVSPDTMAYEAFAAKQKPVFEGN